MASVSINLNFNRQAEEAFNFYKSIFGGEFKGPIMRWGDRPPMEGYPDVPEADKKLIMHMEFEILKGHILMGIDNFGASVANHTIGNNFDICLNLDTRKETDRVFKALSEGGKVGMVPQEMFWGDYFGSCTDKFGIQWIFNCPEKVKK